MHTFRPESLELSPFESRRLTLVTETWPPEINGVAMTLSRLVDGLSTCGWHVSLVRPRQRHDSAIASSDVDLLVPGLPIPGYAGLRFGLPVTGLLRRQWSRERPDVVHIATEGPLGWAALQVACSLGIPVTSTFHTNFHRYCAHYRIGWMRGVVTRHLRNFHNRAAVTLVPNPALADRLQQEGYRSVGVLGRGIDGGLFHPSRRSEALRRSWGVSEGGLAVVYVGRLAPEKNLRTLEIAFAEIERQNPKARMVWVGDGPEMARLRKTYPHHIMAGVRLGESLAAHYASADVFLFPSQTETYGNVVPEALASGLPVVAFDDAAASLYIRHGQNGLLSPLGDQQAFVDCAVSLARQPQQLASMKPMTRVAVEAHSWDAVCSQFDYYLRIAMQSGIPLPVAM